MITTISDALPLQYFRAGVPTFNEDKHLPGIDFQKFFQPFLFDSVIKSQYLGNAAYDLVVTDDAGTELYRIAHVAIAAGVYQTSFVPQDVIVGLVNGSKIRCCIVNADNTDTFDNSFDESFHPTFTGVMYRTDALRIWNNRADLKRILYSNAEDYALIGGYTTNISFEVVAYCKFLKRRFPETNESESLDNYTVEKLSSSVKKQQLIQVEPAPDYFHLKMLFALQHNTIIINNKKWLKEEVYEKKELNEHCMLQTASAWLTEKEIDYFANVYGETALEPTTTTTTMSVACRSYRVNNTGVGHAQGRYLDCANVEQFFDIIEAGFSIFCALQDSVEITSGTGDIIDEGTCATTTTTTPTPTTTTTTPTPTTTTTTPTPTTTTTTPTPTTTTTTLPPACLQYRIQNNDDVNPHNYNYIDCDGGVHSGETVGAGATNFICTRDPGAIEIFGAPITISLEGPCPP